MAAYTVPSGNIAANDKTLAAGVVDTVTFQDAIGGIEVLTDGSAAVYFSVNGTTPTIGGTNTYKIPAAGGVVTRNVNPVPNEPAAIISLLSAGTPTYSVTRSP